MLFGSPWMEPSLIHTAKPPKCCKYAPILFATVSPISRWSGRSGIADDEFITGTSSSSPQMIRVGNRVKETTRPGVCCQGEARHLGEHSNSVASERETKRIQKQILDVYADTEPNDSEVNTDSGVSEEQLDGPEVFNHGLMWLIAEISDRCIGGSSRRQIVAQQRTWTLCWKWTLQWARQRRSAVLKGG